MRLYRELFIILLLHITVVSNANDTIKKRSLSECIKLAIENNYQIKKSKFDQIIAANRTEEIKTNLLPQINASSGLTDNISSPVVILPGDLLGMANTNIPVELVTPFELGAKIELNQVIFDASLFAGIKQAKNAQELIELKSKLNEEEIIYDIGIIYYDILYDEQLLSNLNYSYKIQDSLYIYMVHREKQDLIREIDLNRIRVELSNVKVQKDLLIAKIDQKKKYLKILIGIPINESLHLDKQGLINIKFPTDIIGGQSNVLNSKELAILKKQKELEELNIKSIKSQYIPSLSFVVSGGYLFQSDNLYLANTDSWYDYSFIGVRFNIPIFDGLRKQKQIKQVKYKVKKIDEDIAFRYKKEVISYENAKQLILIGYQTITVQEENLRLAKEIYEQSRLLYKEGLHSTTDLLQTDYAYQEAYVNYWLEIINYKKAELDLMKVKGTLDNLLN